MTNPLILLNENQLFLASLYESTGRAIAITPTSPHVGVSVGIRLYHLNMLMDQDDTLHFGRYWSEVLCSTIMTHTG